MSARRRLAELALSLALTALVLGLWVGVLSLVPIELTLPRPR